MAGESLKLGVQQFGTAAFIAILTRFGLPTGAAMYFESQVARRVLQIKQQDESEQPATFLSIDDLLDLAQDLESGGQTVIGGAILSCLESIGKTHLVATHADEATTFWNSYEQIRNGGVLIIDLSRLATRARPALIHALVTILRGQDPLSPLKQSLCVFFDDAHRLLTRHLLADVVNPMQQHGYTSFFVTERVFDLDDSVLRQADNLFIRRLASDDDARHLAKSCLVDTETLQTLGRRLPKHHSMLIGDATRGYPIIFAAHPLTSAPDLVDTGSRRRMEGSTGAQASAAAELILPLFPDDTPTLVADLAPREPQGKADTASALLPTIAQVVAVWGHVVKRVARRRRSLETILTTARPLRIVGSRLVLGFP